MTWKVVPEAVAIQDSLKPDLTLVNETIDGIESNLPAKEMRAFEALGRCAVIHLRSKG